MFILFAARRWRTKRREENAPIDECGLVFSLLFIRSALVPVVYRIVCRQKRRAAAREKYQIKCEMSRTEISEMSERLSRAMLVKKCVLCSLCVPLTQSDSFDSAASREPDEKCPAAVAQANDKYYLRKCLCK